MNALGQMVRYLLVGGLVTAADLAVYSLLTGRRILSRIRANLLSTTLGMALGFTLHFLVVFHPHAPDLAVRFVRYLATVGFSVYGVQNLVIFLLAEVWRTPVEFAQAVTRRWGGSLLGGDDFIDRMLGKTAATIAGMAWNFFWFKFFVYA
jgi:putative flippase GtrA